MKLLTRAILFGFLLAARVAVAEDTTPHLFNDLNGNGKIDAEEVQASSSSSNGPVEDISLPDTPDDGTDSGQTSSQ